MYALRLTRDRSRVISYHVIKNQYKAVCGEILIDNEITQVRPEQGRFWRRCLRKVVAGA